jgi:hypothetical protein
MFRYVPSNLHTVHIIAEGYTILRQRFGNDSFWLHGPYHYIMKAIFQGEGFYRAFSLHPFTSGTASTGPSPSTPSPQVQLLQGLLPPPLHLRYSF